MTSYALVRRPAWWMTVDQGPHFTDVVFYRNSNSMEISFHPHLDSNIVIATNFCTWHDSCAVVACANFCCDLMASNRITARQSFHRIWIAGKNRREGQLEVTGRFSEEYFRFREGLSEEIELCHRTASKSQKRSLCFYLYIFIYIWPPQFQNIMSGNHFFIAHFHNCVECKWNKQGCREGVQIQLHAPDDTEIHKKNKSSNTSAEE